MTHIDLDTSDDAVKRFVLSLLPAAGGAVLEVGGVPVARLTPVVPTSTAGGPWTVAKDARRCELVDREIDGTLTPVEADELALLQAEMLQHRRRVAPLPLDEARRLYQELLAKANGSA
ncbi:MAG: hypothetical protein K2V38_08880 [Gemmataceae bacterium]|nr:hypothetical protein [Gemmataceae bacterium]